MNDSTENLNWLAFRYIANELDHIERGAFESRLSGDQAAREAVALAVRETAEICTAYREQSIVALGTKQRRASRRMSPVVVAVGSCLSLLVALLLLRTALESPSRVALHPGGNQVNQTDDLDKYTELAFAWAAARDEEDAVSERSSDSLEGDSNGLVGSDEEQLVAPSWMLAALTTMGDEINSSVERQE